MLPMTEADFWEEVEGAAEFDEPLTPPERAKLHHDTGFTVALGIYTHKASADERDAALAEAVHLARLSHSAAGSGGKQAAFTDRDAEPAAWWEAQSQRVFERFRAWQTEALAIVGRATPLRLATVGSYLRQRRAGESERGDRGLFLYYPSGREHPAYSYLEVWRGYLQSEYEAQFWVGQSDPDEAEVRRLEWLDAHRQPLAKLVMMQDELATLTGCEKWQVTQYLLCDVVPLLPWVRFKTPARGRGGEVIEIIVGSPRVPVKAVAAAYAAFRRQDDSARGQALSARSEWPTRLEAFVMEYRSKLQGNRFLWRDCFAAFGERYPQQPYSNTASLKAKYYYARQTETGEEPR